MKRIVTLLLAAGLMLGASSAAQAVDIKMSGQWDFAGVWGDTSFQKDVQKSGKGNGRNTFYQRLRTQIDIIASESLTGVVQFEIGDTQWGQAGKSGAARSAGGAIAGDGVSIEVKRAYIDWMIPQTDLKARVGLQGFNNPSFAGGSQVLDGGYEMMGVTLNYQFNPTVGITGWWFRPYSDNVTTSVAGRKRVWDDMDLFGVAVPLTFDGVKVTPWGMYSAMGRDSLSGIADVASSWVNGSNSQLVPVWFNGDAMSYSSKGQGSAYWLGLTGEVTLWNPFRFAWDFNYGSVDMGHVYARDSIRGVEKFDMKRSGWTLAAIAEYKLDMMTPGLFMWYGSGDDGNAHNGSEMLPTIAGASKFTSFGQDNAMLNMPGAIMEPTLAGTWGVGLQLKDISFVQDLKHTVRATYYRGTNDSKMAANNNNGMVSAPWAKSGLYMTTKDSAWEFNLENTYDIYKNLQLGVDLGYIKLSLSENAWGKTVTNNKEDAYKIAVGLRYTF